MRRILDTSEAERRRRQIIAALGGGFSLVSVFEGGTYPGFYYDFTATTGLYQTTDTSTPVVASADPIGRANDGSPSGNNATQGVSGSRGTWNSGGYWNGDGSDDHLVTVLTPASEMTIAACVRTGSTAVIALGGNAASQRCSIGLNASGSAGGNWAGQDYSVIKGASDLRNTDVVLLLRANGSSVNLWVNGAQVYTGSPSGTPNTSQPLYVGALNNQGVAAVLNWSGRIYRNLAVKRYLPDALVVPLMRHLARPNGNFAGIAF